MSDNPRKAAKRTAEQLKPYRWKPGQSGNPNGRPKNAKQKLSDSFLADMLEAWEAKGKSAINQVIKERPHEFLKVVAAIVPKELHVKAGALEEITDDELISQLDAVRSLLASGAFAALGSGSEKAPRH